MGTVPQAYFSFIMDYAPYLYYIPGTGVDTEWGRGPAPAAHAIDFLVEAYQSSQFESEKTGIYRKRITGARKVFLNKEEYEAIVDAANTNKLAKMLRILGFLTQTKVYLF